MEALIDGLIEADGDTDGEILAEALGLSDGLIDGEALALSVGEILGDAEALSVGDIDALADGDPSSILSHPVTTTKLSISTYAVTESP